MLFHTYNLNCTESTKGLFLLPTFTHAGRLEDVATVAIAVELGSVELENSALRLVVERNWKPSS